MPIGTDFLTFATGGGANIEDQASYQADPQRGTGNLPGIARSNFANKSLRQGTFVACAISTFVTQQINVYVPDDGDVQKYVDYFKQALSALFTGLLPDDPDLSLYLPKAGGTMTGDIQFVPGASLQLANATWLRAKNSAGTPQNVLMRGADGNIYFSDGSSAYTHFGNTPTVANGRFLSGLDTAAGVHGILGILGDNNTYLNAFNALFINSSTTWFNSNIVVPNNSSYYGTRSGGGNAALIGMDTANNVNVAGGAADTYIYAGSTRTIYLVRNTNCLGNFNAISLVTSGGLDVTGGALLRGSLQVNGAANFYAHLNVNGSVGATITGTLDCTNLHAVGGNATIDGAMSVGASMTVGVNCQAVGWIAGSNVFAGARGLGLYDTGNAQNQIGVNGGFYVQGQLNVGGPTILAGTMSVAASMTVGANLQATGWVQGSTLYAGARAIGFYDTGNAQNQLGLNGGLSVRDQLNVGGPTILANVNATSGVFTGSVGIGSRGLLFYDTGNPQNQLGVNGGFAVSSQLNVVGPTYFGGTMSVANAVTLADALTVYGPVGFNSALQVNGNTTFYGGLNQFTNDINVQGGCTASGMTAGNYGLTTSGNIRMIGGGLSGTATIITMSSYYDGSRPYAIRVASDWWRVSEATGTPEHAITDWFAVMHGGIEVLSGGTAQKQGGGMWGDNSERRLKKDIEDYTTGLDTITRLRPRSYEFNGEGGTAANGKRYVGLIYDEVEDLMPEMLGTLERPLDDGTGQKETMKRIDATAVIYALVNSVRELSDRLETLEGRAA